MAVVKLIQSSFAGGELDEALHSRTDFDKYPISLATLKNGIVRPHGTALNRPGTVYVATAKNADKKARLIGFVPGLYNPYLIEAGDQYLRFFKDGAPVVTSTGASYEVATAYLEADLPVIETTQSADVLYLAHEAYQPKTLSRFSDTNWALSNFDFKRGPFLDENTTTTTITVTGKMQEAKPASDIAAGTWTASAGGVLYAMVDESVTPSDSDYAAAGAGSTTMEVKLGSVSTPANRRGHLVRVRLGNAADNVTVQVKCGAAVVATAHLRTKAEIITYEFYLTEAQATLITDYTDLRVAVTGATALRCYWVNMVCPMPSVGGSGVDVTDIELSEGSVVTLTASGNIFDANHVGSVFGIRHTTLARSWHWRPPSTGAINSMMFPVLGAWTITITPDGSALIDEADLYIAYSIDDGNTWTDLEVIPQTSSTNIKQFTGDQEEFAWFRIDRRTSPSNDQAEIVVSVDGKAVNAAFKVTAYTSPTVVTATLQTDFTRPGNKFKTWKEGAWSNYRGWPRTVAFDGSDRLFFASTTSQPVTLWGSGVGDYPNFGESIPMVADDAINKTLVSRVVNAIRHLVPLDNLLAMTAAAEWKITGAGGDDAMSATSFWARPQTYRGSSTVPPLIVDDDVLFVQDKGASVRNLAYTLERDKYSGNELSVLVKSLLDGREIVDWDYQQEPWSIVWMVLDDGKLLGMTYMREHQVVAWHHHETEGEFESVCCIPGTGRDDVYFIVKRTINGVTVRYIEKLHSRVFATLADAIFMDSAKTVTYSTAATVITGLNHLEGKAVSVLADGVVVYDKTVNSGAITLDVAANKVQVGLPFNTDFKQLNVDIGMTREGTVQGRKKRVAAATLRLKNSAGGKVGPDENNLVAIARDSTLTSGDVRCTLKSNWEDGGQVLVRQDKPLPIEILAIMREVEFGDTTGTKS